MHLVYNIYVHSRIGTDRVHSSMPTALTTLNQKKIDTFGIRLISWS